MKNHLRLTLLLLVIFTSCDKHRLTKAEAELINSGKAEEAMRVLSVFSLEDSLFLRRSAMPVTDVLNKNVLLLAERMLTTVSDTVSGGVGIAAPQVGISRRLIIVQRFDKESEPFEVYFNPEIHSSSENTILRNEGCLSIPGYRGPVVRPESIELSYMDNSGQLQTETVHGFTARIFMHEIDHLNGVLYSDLLPPGESIRAIE
jgi:peptide deformylase